MTTPTVDAESRKLLPCPFCGGEPAVLVRGGAAGVSCKSGHFVSTYGADSVEAIAAWNTRAAPSPTKEG